MTEVKSLYSDRAEERRRQFNNIINKMDLVLMNKIPEVDDSVWENWESITPNQECEIVPAEDVEEGEDVGEFSHYCKTHMVGTDDEDGCEEDQSGEEVYQWFAVNQSDAEYLKDHGQYITYSDMLDTYFLAITHMGTSWDYVDSMVEAFADSYHGLDDFSDEAK